MWDLILEYGMPTVSWYAEFALRRRVSMSAIGSVIVMAYRPSLATVSETTGPSAWSAPPLGGGALVIAFSCRYGHTPEGGGLPAGLRDAGQLAPVRHLP